MTEVYHNQYFSVRKNNEYHFIYEPFSENAAAVLIKHKERGFILIDIFRHSLNKTVYEIPRGNANYKENSCDCAIREVAEETGYIINRNTIKKLGSVNPNSGILSSTIDLYYTEVSGDSTFSTDGEAIQNVYFSYDELVKQIKLGIIQDSFTLSALSLYLLSNFVTNQ